MTGLEPALHCYKQILNLPCLPIPPHRRSHQLYTAVELIPIPA